MTTRGDEKQVEEIVADLAELRASLAEQFSALRENLLREKLRKPWKTVRRPNAQLVINPSVTVSEMSAQRK